MKDLSGIKVGQTADVELLDPMTTEGMGAFFILAGPNHPVREGLELARDRKLRLEIKKKGRVDLGDPEQDRRDEIDYLVACTLGWYSIDSETKERREHIVFDGKELPFSQGDCRRIYEDKDRSWIRKQIKGDLRDDDVFLRGSSASSSGTPAGNSSSAAG